MTVATHLQEMTSIIESVGILNTFMSDICVTFLYYSRVMATVKCYQ